MVKRNRLKSLNFILCLALVVLMMPIGSLAMDSPKDGYIEVFPVPGNSDTVIVDNYGTVNYAKSEGKIRYNYHRINNLEGATVDENKSTGLIDNFVSGRVENNYGTINKVTNTASVGTNTPGGVIKENFNDVDKNMGTIENQYSGTIKENYGNVGTVGVSASIAKMYEGTVTENNGNVVIYPEPGGIVTVVKIGTNNKSVRIEADANNKSTVVIDSVEDGASLYVCDGADCTVIDNAGTITIEEGGRCNITGKNTGTVTGDSSEPGEEYNYKLILDNINPEDITFVDFFKKDGDNIYVMDGGPNHNVIVTYDTNKYCYPNAYKINGVMAIGIENSDFSVLDDTNKTFTIHFHSVGEYVHTSGEKHIHKCGGNWKGSKCTATFNEESCSLIPATCTNRAKCEKCGTEYGNYLSHSYSWVSENGKHKQVCDECGDIVNIGDCSYGEWIIDSEAKVGVPGKKHRVCSVCSGVENATIPAKKDSGKKQNDNGQGGSGQETNPTKEDTPSTVNPTKADTPQAINRPKGNDDTQKKDSAGADSDEKTGSNPDRRDEEVNDNDSTNPEPDSKAVIDDSKSSQEEIDVTDDFDSDETVTSSGNSKTGIIVGAAAIAAAAAIACFIILFRRKRSGK